VLCPCSCCVKVSGQDTSLLAASGIRDDNGSGRVITRPSAKRLRVEIYTRARG
jgi:hypothetical protein